MKDGKFGQEAWFTRCILRRLEEAAFREVYRGFMPGEGGYSLFDEAI
jgi:hypothetical protein